MSAEVVKWISSELSKLLGAEADDAVARQSTHLLTFTLY